MPNVALGLDLGAAADYTALAAVEQFPMPPQLQTRDRWRYVLRGLDRFELGLPYPQMVAGIRARIDTPQLRGCRVAADYTGVGRPVVDMLKAANVPAKLVPILITGGHTVTWSATDGCWHVPKKDISATLLVLLDTGRLKWSPSLPLAAQLQKELTDFRTKITPAGNEVTGAWADGQHDDLVLALALACWLLEKRPVAGAEPPTPADGLRRPADWPDPLPPDTFGGGGLPGDTFE